MPVGAGSSRLSSSGKASGKRARCCALTAAACKRREVRGWQEAGARARAACAKSAGPAAGHLATVRTARVPAAKRRRQALERQLHHLQVLAISKHLQRGGQARSAKSDVRRVPASRHGGPELLPRRPLVLHQHRLGHTLHQVLDVVLDLGPVRRLAGGGARLGRCGGGRLLVVARRQRPAANPCIAQLLPGRAAPVEPAHVVPSAARPPGNMRSNEQQRARCNMPAVAPAPTSPALATWPPPTPCTGPSSMVCHGLTAKNSDCQHAEHTLAVTAG